MSDRREFLKKTTAILGATLAGSAAMDLGCAFSTAPLIKADVTGSFIRFDTGIPELSKHGDGVALTSEQLDYPILLIRRKDETFSALSTECMHLGCTVKKQKTVLRCPCHGSVYDFEGNVMNGPTEKPLRTYEVVMSGSMAEIKLL